MLYYNKTTEQTLKGLETSESGLQAAESKRRLTKYGPNTIRLKGEPLWRKLIEPFADIFMLVLFIAAILSIIHHTPIDAIIIISIMLISAVIYYIQRFSTDRVLRSLQKHTAQTVSVIRDGKVHAIDSLRLVPGDIILLAEGEKVPADARLLEGSGVRVDEALLTGESEPIAKTVDALKGEKQIYERTNLLFQGSFIISGEATAVVVETGNSTEFGRLAKLSQPTNLRSPVQKKIDKLISQIIAVIGGVSVITFALSILRGTEFVESIRFVMALAVSAVPESLPIAISVVLVLGMRRMALKKALVRNMRAIETIGVVTTIATDKTGTLTKNKLSVQEIWQPAYADTDLKAVVQRSINQGATVHDPLDIAMIDYVGATKTRKHAQAKPLHSLPFSHEYAASGNLYYHGSAYLLTLKGAPEAILVRADITKTQKGEAEATLQQLTSQGYRVIALGETELKEPIEDLGSLSSTQKLNFSGFVAIADTLRPEAKRAIKRSLAAGVTVRMITGDHLETAFHIGKQLGMVEHKEQVFDSRKMDSMTDDELAKAVDDARIFSRVIPENKYRLLSVLKRKHITAMTGDGVNDVPALSNAHVGISMGSGSQIAKDAGDIILLDDNFKSIIDAMSEGRTIISNIRRMLYYLLATNAGEVLTILGALIIGMPAPLVAVQILWVNLVTDTSMVIPLGLEKGEKGAMTRMPEKPNAPILNRHLTLRMIIVALSMAIVTLSMYAVFSAMYGHEYGRTIAFCALVVMQWASAFNARSDYESIFRRIRVWSTPFYVGLGVAITMQILAVFGPLQGLMHITPVLIGDLIVTSVIAFIVPIVIVEIHKWFGRRTLQ
jgi:Ca2+-transporting ATPase